MAVITKCLLEIKEKQLNKISLVTVKLGDVLWDCVTGNAVRREGRNNNINNFWKLICHSE